MLPLKQQITLILVDIYDFKVAEVSVIMGIGVGAAKHLLRDARQTMLKIFDQTCALLNKNGVCNQCSGLNGKFYAEQDHQGEFMKIKWVKDAAQYDTKQPLKLRSHLLREINPLESNGTDLHELFLSINHTVNRA